MTEATGTILIEGKTKIVRESTIDETVVIIESKDDITAGDGAKHDIMQGKAAISTATTSNVFQLLKACGIPLAFEKQLSPTEFQAAKCKMLPYEVVIRREAHGSYLKRHPYMKKGQIFPRLILEFFLKTSGKKWGEHDLPCDDPFCVIEKGTLQLFHPKQPFHTQEPFLVLEEYPLDDRPEVFKEMGEIAKRVFLILEKSWQLLGRRLVDFKVEFGFTEEGRLLLADVIDNDSWRVVEDGQYIDKQFYRENGDLDEVTRRYRRVQELTGRFSLPRQRIVLWTGSSKDKTESFSCAFLRFKGEDCTFETATYSMHKQPIHGAMWLDDLIQDIPDCVVIVHVGLSNGAGPTLSARATVPVITVPANWKERPHNVWSSLETPSEVPVSTILRPQNAVLHAVQILAMRNPRLYALLRLEQEERLINTVVVS